MVLPQGDGVLFRKEIESKQNELYTIHRWYYFLTRDGGSA